MTGSSFIDKVVFDPSGADPEARADLWADAVRPLYDASLLGGKAETHSVRGDAWLLGPLLLTSAAFGDQLIHRHKPHFSADSTEMVLIEFYLRGNLRGELDGHPVDFGAGDIHMIDFTREYRARSSPTDARGIVMSHEMIGYDPARHPPLIHIPGDSVTGRVVRHTILGIHDQLNRTTKAEAATVASGLIALLRTVLFNKTQIAQSAPSFAIARSRAIRDHIQQNLRTDQLNTDRICSRFNISRTTLYREFKAEGGLYHHILDQRLEAALMTLAFCDEHRGAVARTAERWGFSSAAYFSREFKRKFGFGPSNAVAQGNRSPADRSSDASLQVERIDPLLKKL